MNTEKTTTMIQPKTACAVCGRDDIVVVVTLRDNVPKWMAERLDEHLHILTCAACGRRWRIRVQGKLPARKAKRTIAL